MLLAGIALNREIHRQNGKTDVQTQVFEEITDALARGRRGEPGGMRPNEFSLRKLFTSTVANGYEALQMLDPRNEVEATEAVDSSFFSKITGQIIYSQIHQAYENEAFVFSRLIPNVPTPFLDGEKIPGMTRIGDEAETVGEGQQYPEAGFSDEYTETPRTDKRGLIVSVTREAIFTDRTGLILGRASEVGEWLGLNKEKRLIDVAIGATNNYKRNGTASNTYQTSTPWINDQSNELVDWNDIEASWLLLRGMTDPNTGEPIMIMGSNVVVAPAKAFTASRLLSATEVRHTTNTNTQTLSSNPVAGLGISLDNSELFRSRVESQLSVSAANSKLYWLHGDFRKAFAYMEAFPLTTAQAPTNATLAFDRDIVARYKASERGVAAVKDPRYVIRNKN